MADISTGSSLLPLHHHGIGLIDAADPLGNRQPTAELVVYKDDGAILHPGIFIVYHGGQRLQVVETNPEAGTSDYFDLDSESGRALVVQA